MVMGPILGPVIGGLIVSNYSWRWIFYINVPIGIITLLLSSRWLPKFDTEVRSTTPFDTLGFCLLSPGLGLFVYGLSQAGQGAASSVFVPAAIGALLIAAFVWHALHTKVTPLIEVLLFRDRQFAAASATTAASPEDSGRSP